MEKALKRLARDYRQQMDDYLEAINNNTNEIHSNYEEILLLQQRIKKLEEELETIKEKLSMKKDLSLIEERVLRALSSPLTVKELSRITGYSSGLIEKTLHSLIIKGFPIHRKSNKFFLASRLKLVEK